MSTVQVTPDTVYALVCQHLSSKEYGGSEAQKRVMAHLRSVVGRTIPLPLYHNDKSITDEAKVETYAQIVRALRNKDWSLLQGQQSREDDKRIDVTDVAKPPVPVETAKPQPPAAPEIPPDRLNPITRAIFEEIRPLLNQAPLDLTAIRKVADESFAHNINNGGFPVDRLQNLIDERVNARLVALQNEVAGLRNTLVGVAALLAEAGKK